jgi:hypothetical protein
MDVASYSETFSPANIGKYPVERKWYEREKIMKRKHHSWRKLNRKKTQIADSDLCSRTKGFSIACGVENWYFWCKCKRNCSEKWSYKWLLHIRGIYINQNKLEQRTTLLSLIVKVGSS